jgi:hypothetical protein
MNQTQRLTRRAFTRFYDVPVLVLLMLVFGASPETAQGQWAAPSSGSSDITNTNTGNVGIGTIAAPTAKLDVNGSAIFSGSTTVAGRGTFFIDYTNNTLNFSVSPNGFRINAPTFINGGLETFGNYFGMREMTNNVLRVVIPSLGSAYFNQGNVGIGTTNPLNLFHVHDGSVPASMRVSGVGLGAVNFIDSSAAANSKLFQWRSEGGLFRMALVNDAENAYVQQNLLVANAAGNVGIGTANPLTRFQVDDQLSLQKVATGYYQLSRNAYYSNGWKYITNDYASFLEFGLGGEINFYQAPSGTAGAGFTPTSAMFIKNNGNVGIGMIAPNYKLDVAGQLNATGGLCIGSDCKTAWSQVGGSQWTSGTGAISYSAGNVGIGTDSPSAARLHLQSPSHTYLRIGAPLANQSAIAFNDDTHGQDVVLYRPEGTRDLTVWTATANRALTINQSGNVGIGTATPNGKLDVVGASGAPNYVNGSTGLLRVGTSNEHIEFGYVTGNRTWLQSFGAVPLHINEGGNNVIFNAGGGNVGIGTQSPPTAKLEVAGQVKSSSGGFVFPDGTVQTTAATGGGSGSSVAAGNVTAGQFGAGNYIFPGNVDITGSLSWGNNNSRTDWKHDAGAVASKSGFFETNNPVNYPAGAAGWWHLIESRHQNSNNNYALQIAGSFGDQNLYTRKTNLNSTSSATTAWSKFVLQDSDGNTAIGASPSSTLNVQGNISVSGNINAKYQDVAEWVESSQKLEAGTVVALDPEKSNQVLASAEAYDTRVAGVVSAQPGISLGERGEGKVLVATTGRVKVKVDATRTPVKIGDLLVTSGVKGLAMKSLPVDLGGTTIHRPGTIIGKALEPLAGGVGEILVLLSLQ